MSTAIATRASAYRPPPAYRDADASPQSLVARLRILFIWLIAFSGGFVMIEPAPYELITVLAMIVFAITGLSLRASQIPLLVLLIIHNLGFVIATLPIVDVPDIAKWTAVSAMLSASTVFFAMILTHDTQRRLDVLINGYVACAVLTSFIAVLAFFKLVPGWELFILNLRAKAAFKDPNVYGPFLVLPGMILILRVISGGWRNILFGGVALSVVAAGLFLSFSRGAWANFAVSAVVMLVLIWVTSRSVNQRIHIALFAIFGAAAMVAVVVALLSVKDVSALFSDRATLVKDYDAGPEGRFGRHLQGLLMIQNTPLGLGPLQFSKFFNYEPHNAFIDPFMNGGWLAGISWLVLNLMTLLFGLRHVFVRTPWQMTYIAVYASFVGEVGESYIIDVQHWRHYFLIMGVIWGLMTAWRPAARPERQGSTRPIPAAPAR